MTMYRIVSRPDDEYEPIIYALTKEAAIAEMVELAQEDKDRGRKYYEYTDYAVEALEFDAKGTADEFDWKTVLECTELTDIFPAPRRNSDGVYEDEDDFWEDEDEE